MEEDDKLAEGKNNCSKEECGIRCFPCLFIWGAVGAYLVITMIFLR